MSKNSSSVKQDPNNLFQSSVMTLSSLGTPSTLGSFISRLPAFDALQRGFIVCFHAFSNLFRDSFRPTLLCLTQILCSFPSFSFEGKALTCWKMPFYFSWSPSLCFSACSAFLAFLTDAMQLLWAPITTSLKHYMPPACILHFWLLLTILLIFFPSSYEDFLWKINHHHNSPWLYSSWNDTESQHIRITVTSEHF